MKRNYTLTFLCTLLLATLTGCNSDDSIELAAKQSTQQFEAAGVKDMQNDAFFIAEAASIAMLQLQLSEVASTKAVSPEVKELAERMQEDHQQLLTDIQDMAEQSMFVLPQSLGNAHQKIYDEVNEQEGLSFDITYVREVQELHDMVLDRYSDMADNGVNMDVKMFASSKLPLIRQHIDLTKEISERIDNAL